MNFNNYFGRKHQTNIQFVFFFRFPKPKSSPTTNVNANTSAAASSSGGCSSAAVATISTSSIHVSNNLFSSGAVSNSNNRIDNDMNDILFENDDSRGSNSSINSFGFENGLVVFFILFFVIIIAF